MADELKMVREIGEIRGENLHVRVYVNEADLLIFDPTGNLPCSKGEVAETLGIMMMEMILQKESTMSGKPPRQCFHLEARKNRKPNRG